MRVFDRLCPSGPDWDLDWDAICERFAWVRAMAGVGQDPRHHAEGDVAEHTRLAVLALVGLPGWRACPRERQVRLFAAVLLHDVAKPDCTRVEDGHVHARGHARRGDLLARRILWELGAPPGWREQVAALVAHHQVPLRAMDRPDLERIVLRVSLLAANDDLALLAEADARGRVCADADALLEQVGLFREYCAELGVLDAAWPFASDHARFMYFRTPGRDPGYAAFDDTRSVVTVMSGLPGVGKDTWLAANRPGAPVVSLDELRGRLGVAPTADQGPVVAAAYARARELLRAGQPFVWNATNVSRQQRDLCVGLAASYRARVEIVALEAPPPVVRARNSGRDAAVPQAAWERMLGRWQAPDVTEAHAVHRIDTGMMDHFT
ncbi:AAA family ATPase [Catellatospora tritici]|uniref:AAA family ATPase n=1 Tax=Catellatospora tritici TaxID=2851566 RepID=UPI001C2CF40D|nr:AAA family ATPase [Catellatospora tritici]MBV1850808.1 AAA family ATPase [Catellatospora tritici]MBV1851061.1 AAA family ATPase [Catellatospora tritici]